MRDDHKPSSDLPESLPQQARRLRRTASLLFRRRRAISGPIAWAASVLLAPVLINGACDLGGGIDGYPYHVGWVLWTLIVFLDGVASTLPDVAVVWAMLAPLPFRMRIVSSLPVVLIGYLMNDHDLPGWVLLSSLLCWLIVALSLQPVGGWLRGSLQHRRLRPSGDGGNSFRILHLLIVTLAVAVVFAVVRWYDLWRVADPLVDAGYSETGLAYWIAGTVSYVFYVLLIVLPLVLVVLRTTSLRAGVVRACLLIAALVAAYTSLSVGTGWYVAYPDSVSASVAYCCATGAGSLLAAASFAVALRWAGYRFARDPSRG